MTSTTYRKLGFFLFWSSAMLTSARAQVSPPNQLAAVSAKEDGEGDMRQTVFPIVTSRINFSYLGLELDSGTGFCLDTSCRYIGTNYHVASLGHYRRIKNAEIVHSFLATGPSDKDAAPTSMMTGGSMNFALARDLAIFELRHPLKHHHGLAFSLNDMQIGQEVDIYTSPGRMPFRSLIKLSGAFSGRTTSGLFAFDYKPSGGRTLSPGASGGIVVDRKTHQIVAILCGVEIENKLVALAVPASTLATFLEAEIPFLAAKLFPAGNGKLHILADLYPKFVPASRPGLQRRDPEPAEVVLLRQKAQSLADSMKNYIAVQNFQWGSGEEKLLAESALEVQVTEGTQTFRAYPDGKKLLSDIPFPNLADSMVPGGEWSELPAMVGQDRGLNIHQAPNTALNGRPIKVFQYWASIEDNVCSWRTVDDFIFFSRSKSKTVACYGEVWTDEDTNILRISENDELSGSWHDYRGAVNYGWLRNEGEPPRLIPVSFSTQVLHNKTVYWCRGLFTKYRRFDVRSRLIASDSAPSSVSRPN